MSEASNVAKSLRERLSENSLRYHELLYLVNDVHTRNHHIVIGQIAGHCD